MILFSSNSQCQHQKHQANLGTATRGTVSGIDVAMSQTKSFLKSIQNAGDTMSDTLDSLIKQMLKKPLQDGMTPTQQLLQQLSQEERDRKADDAGSPEDGDM